MLRRNLLWSPQKKSSDTLTAELKTMKTTKKWFDACIQDLVRCVALTRLVYGDGHLKLAQAHARLAKAYFQFKGLGLQAQEHSLLAKEHLPFFSSISSCRDEKLEAHAIAMSHSPEELERAQISHSLALILSAAAEPHHNGHYFEQSLNSYKNSVGLQDPAFLAAQDDFCHFLLLNGQQERCVDIQRASLTSKRSTYSDLSAEVADTLQLIGSVEMSEGKMKQAYRTLTKCLEIQSLLYGPQHKKTKATQKAVDMLARAPGVAESLQRQGKRKTNTPHTFSALPSSGKEGSISDS
ncbi:hypothetical protein PAMA_019367 [Pampus argenteus]